MPQKDCSIQWPEIVCFIGAGANVEIGLRTTSQLSELLSNLSKIDIKDFNNSFKPSSKIQNNILENDFKHIKNLFFILEYSNQKESERKERILEIRKESFKKIPENKWLQFVKEIKNRYDWITLKKLIRITPIEEETENHNIMDLFNIIDYHIESNMGFYLRINSGKEEYIQPEKLVHARNTLALIIMTFFHFDYKSSTINKKNSILKYYNFAKAITNICKKSAVYRSNSEEHELHDRKFYLNSLSFISMNWDNIFYSLLCSANYNHNEFFSNYNIINKDNVSYPLHNYWDLGFITPIKNYVKNKSSSSSLHLHLNESIPNRMNKERYLTDRVTTIGKFLFPHGAIGLRRCESCGKPSFNINYSIEENEITEYNFIAPTIIGNPDCSQSHSKEEKKKWDEGLHDIIYCRWCNHETQSTDHTLIMQTLYKRQFPYFLQEIHSERKIYLEHAKHILFLGYSLPPDDTVYRTLLSSVVGERKEKKNTHLFVTVIDFTQDLPP